MNKFLTSAAMALALSCVAASASAEVITWTLEDVVFQDGATASGSFDYDTATGRADTFSISTTESATLSAFDYVSGGNSFFFAPNFFSGNSLIFLENGFSRYLNLAFAGSLSTPGEVALRVGVGSNDSSWECNNCDSIRYVTGGSVVSGAVPEPSAWALMILGFGAAGAVLRGRKVSLAA